MPPLRKNNDRDESEVREPDEVELLDSSDVMEIDDDIEQVEDDDLVSDDEVLEIVDADDEIIESLDDESTGEVFLEPEKSPADVSGQHQQVQEQSFVHDSPGQGSCDSEILEDDRQDEDPLSSFASSPGRHMEVEEYIGSGRGLHEAEEEEDSTPRMVEEFEYEFGDPEPDESTSKVESPEADPGSNERMDTQSSATQMIFDENDEGDEPADWQDDSEQTPGVGEFSQTGMNDPDDQEYEPHWADDSTLNRDANSDPDEVEYETGEFLPHDGLENGDNVQGQEDIGQVLNWSSLEDQNGAVLPDVGETRIDSNAPVGPVVDEKTLIFDAGGESEDQMGPADPALLVLKGEDEGREIELNRDQLTLGRGPENDLVFADIACSRRHAMIEFDGANWVLSDLGSGNGTLLNGEKIATKENLYDGDMVEVGSTTLKFIWPGAPESIASEDNSIPESALSSPVVETVANAGVLTKTAAGGFLSKITSDPKQKKILLIVSASFCGLILLLLLVKLILPSGPPTPNQEQLFRQKQLETRRQFEKHLAAAKELVQKKDWNGALLEIQQARKFNQDSEIAKEYQEDIRKELSASNALEQARIAMDARQWDVAMAALTRIDKESEYATQAQVLKREIDENVISDILNKGLALMKDGKYHQALVKFDDIKRKDPDNIQVDELRRDCQKQIDLEERRLRGKSSRSRRRRKRKITSRAHRAVGATTGQVLALYKNGEIDRAIFKAQDREDSKQVAMLRKFRSIYKKGIEKAHKTGLAKDALKLLASALSLDRKISGGKGKYHDIIVKNLANVCFLVGMDNMQSGKYSAAYRYFRKTLKYKPGEPHAKKQISILASKAKTLYESAYIIRSADPQKATDYLTTVIRIVPPQNIYYSKAKNLLRKLRPSGNYDDGNSGF